MQQKCIAIFGCMIIGIHLVCYTPQRLAISDFDIHHKFVFIVCLPFFGSYRDP